MSKNEVRKSAGSVPATVGHEVSGLSSGMLAAAQDLDNQKLRQQQSKGSSVVPSTPEEDPGFFLSLFGLALSPLILPLGLGFLAYEKVWRPIADHLRISKQLKLDSERRLAELKERESTILSEGEIHDNAPKLNYRNARSGDFSDMASGNDGGETQGRNAMLNEAQTLVDRATRSLRNKNDPKILTEKREGDLA